MTEIRSAADVRHVTMPIQAIGQLPPPPPAKTQRSSISHIQKQNSFKREPDSSPGHQVTVPAFPPQTSVINCPPAPSTVVRGVDSMGSSPTDGPSSPKQPHSFASDKSWHLFQNQDGHLSWTQFEEGHHLLGNEEDSSEKHSSDDEFDIWCITDEQKEYYINQFRSMQPDIKGKITGSIAKDFFEKSKLPVQELSRIWQLSDVDKDGALSLEEFCTAMHLVVLRRNNIELPEVLPASLVPRIAAVKRPIENVPVTNQSQLPQAVATAAVVVVQNQTENSPKHSPTAEVASPPNKEWTKFNDSPTSSLSSPGMKPVNFDFSAASVEQNPKILHPVALRLSPDHQPESYNSTSDGPPAVTDDIIKIGPSASQQVIHKPKARKPLGPSLSVTSKPPSNCESDAVGAQNSSSSFSGTSSATRSNSLSQGAISISQGPKKEPPPPPPPRPKHNHIRSSSLDLNNLGSTVPHFLSIPPAIPPRASPSTATPLKSGFSGEDVAGNAEVVDFADFANFEDDPDNSKLLQQLHLKGGAFEVYRKPFPSPSGPHAHSSSGSETCLLEQSLTPAVADDITALLVDIEQDVEGATAAPDNRKRHVSAPPLALVASSLTSIPKDRRELQSAIRAHRERNKMLTLFNNELNQELSEVMEERIALEIQLEHLKPYS